jgi:hypothetical protein
MALARNAAQPAGRRSQRPTHRRSLFGNHAQVRAAWKRGMPRVLGLPRRGVFFQTRVGLCARMPRVRRGCRRAWASSPVSVTRTCRRCRGRPRLPVRRCTASSQGTTWARSSPWAGVLPVAKGLPAAAVSRWRSLPVPVPPRAPPSPPPVPGGTGAVHGPVWPLKHPVCFGQPAEPGVHRGQRALGLPALQPPMRRTLGRPWRAAREITPAAAGNQPVQSGMQHLANGRMRHPAPTARRCRGNKVRKAWPFQVAQAVEPSGHRALLPRLGAR